MKPLKIAAVALAAIVMPWGAQAAGPKTLEVLHPWSRPAAAGTTGIGYMVIANRGRAADALVGVDSPIASRVEMHSSSTAGGIMSMKTARQVAIPAGRQVTFGPGAYHLMFIGLTRALNPGDRVPATLAFSSGAKLAVSFQVSTGAGPPPTADR